MVQVLSPNITGRARFFVNEIPTSANSALYVENGDYSVYANKTATASAGINFDASRSNSIYTAGGSIIPLSLALNYVIKV